MKICFSGNFTGGGTERAAFLLANELSKKYDVYIINTSKNQPTFLLNGPVVKELNSKGVLDSIRKMRCYLQNNDIDVLVSLEALGGICGIPATAFSKCKLIIWEHANYYQTQGSRYTHFMRWLEMLVADAYVVLTKRDLNNFKNHFKYIRTKLVQIYNIAEPVKDTVYNLGSKTIISAGHINKIKNFSIIPEIASKVFEKHPDWTWKIYGYASDDYDTLIANIKKYHLEDKVFPCGRCEDMDKAYQEASIYVMTSLQEGFPMVLLEARAHGLPIISFDIETGPDEIVQNGVNGFLVEPYDKDEMARSIKCAIENDTLRKSFSDHSQTGLELWTAERIAEQWNQLLLRK